MCLSGDDVMRLTDKHLISLFHQLENYAYKWKDIGANLGFLPGELYNIEASPNLMQSAPVSWLQAILIKWVQRAAGGSGSFATLQSLKNALNKAGLAAAAHDLKIESNEATAMGLGGASATGLLHVHTLGQPSMPTPSTYPQTPAMPHPLNQAYRVPLNQFYHPPYGRKYTYQEA